MRSLTSTLVLLAILGGLVGYKERLRLPQVAGLAFVAVGVLLATLPLG